VLDPALDDAGAETLDAARNACTALALDPAATEADALRAFVSTFTNRRDQRERGFARLTDEQIDFLARLCVDLWKTHRDEQGARPTLPAPPAAEGEHHDYGCRCPECDEDWNDAPSAAELLEHDRREYARLVRESLR
jgi:hypothetical protein